MVLSKKVLQKMESWKIRPDSSKDRSSSRREKSVSRPPPRSGGRRAKEKKSQIS
jgi:hypothetical protein